MHLVAVANTRSRNAAAGMLAALQLFMDEVQGQEPGEAGRDLQQE